MGSKEPLWVDDNEDEGTVFGVVGVEAGVRPAAGEGWCISVLCNLFLLISLWNSITQAE